MVSETDKYTYRVMWSDEDEEFIGLCAEFPSLSWLGKTSSGALNPNPQIETHMLHELLIPQQNEK